ncbi:bacteriocin-like protein [Chryseobacterium sp. SIMBA_029]|uniref:bacteriocin-like protein n=1 Tax=Chryseobacterium sp. SIMBA_029 TaxID=3085772 RepID=UPI00397968CB
MKNLKKISRSELRTVKGGIENNCHCSPGDSGLPPRDSWTPDSDTCFRSCVCYRKGGC